jgi:type VI secretion system protein ImpC
LTPELQTKWKKLRLSKDSKNIGLTFPRYLLRYPYGEKDNPIDSFNFEELGSEPEQEDFLWGNSAFLCACIFTAPWLEAKSCPS